jgi:hypothetical protein
VNLNPSTELALGGGPSFMAYIHELNNNRNQSSTSNPNSQPTSFPLIESEQEVICEESKDNFESASSSPKIYYETWFHIPQEEIQ